METNIKFVFQNYFRNIDKQIPNVMFLQLAFLAFLTPLEISNDPGCQTKEGINLISSLFSNYK